MKLSFLHNHHTNAFDTEHKKIYIVNVTSLIVVNTLCYMKTIYPIQYLDLDSFEISHINIEFCIYLQFQSEYLKHLSPSRLWIDSNCLKLSLICILHNIRRLNVLPSYKQNILYVNVYILCIYGQYIRKYNLFDLLFLYILYKNNCTFIYSLYVIKWFFFLLLCFCLTLEWDLINRQRVRTINSGRKKISNIHESSTMQLTVMKPGPIAFHSVKVILLVICNS